MVGAMSGWFVYPPYHGLGDGVGTRGTHHDDDDNDEDVDDV